MHSVTISARVIVAAIGGSLVAASSLADTRTAQLQNIAVDPSESAYLTRGLIFVDSPELGHYISNVTKRLLEASHITMTLPNLLIQSSEEFDLFTDSKRNLVISTGALRELSSEDELAAALSHELSHLILRHPQRKDAMRAVPLGFDTAEYVSIAADRLRGASGQRRIAGRSKFGDTGIVNAQATSMLWTDVISPSWNRRQERAADENGLLLMRAAGYEPSVFGTLFQRLHAAQGKRTERMELLGKIMLARVKEKTAQAGTKSAGGSANSVAAKWDALGDELRNNLSEAAVKHVVDGLTSFNREYDSPLVRQQNLAKFAHEHRLLGKPPNKQPSQFAEALRGGRGSWLLGLDAAAIRALDAMNAHDMTAAKTAMAPLLAAASAGNPPTAHLNLAFGAWQEATGHPDRGEARARAWVAGRWPPANAYVWLAYHQFSRKDYSDAMTTLERGRRRVGNGAPFLPQLVSVARASGDEKRAEGYALECQDEDRKNVNSTVAAFFGGNRVPSGLYADCVQRLGHEPKSATEAGAVMQAVKNPLQTAKSLTDRLRNKFRSRDKPVETD